MLLCEYVTALLTHIEQGVAEANREFDESKINAAAYGPMDIDVTINVTAAGEVEVVEDPSQANSGRLQFTVPMQARTPAP